MKLKFLFFTICLTVLLAADAGVWAQQELQLVVSELKVFPVYGLRRVAVGDPSVADVTVLSDRELMLMAKKAGATSLIIWDESGQRAFNISVIEKDLEKIAERIRGLFASSDIRGVRVKVEEDKIYLIGDVLTEREVDKVKDIFAPFANVVNLVKIKERLPMVEIDINVLEVASDDIKTLGLDWTHTDSWPITYSEPSTVDGKAPKFWKVFRWDRTTVDARLNLLIEQDSTRTLANPKLVTLSGKEASFLIGGEVPYIIVEEEGRTSVEWKQYGINLKIAPRVNAKNEIKTKIEAEVSETGDSMIESGYSIPSIITRKVQTELFLNEGDTVFLAGLIKDVDTNNVDRIPWLSKVPILGELFKSRYYRDRRTELVITITPRIIGERPDPEYVANEMLKQEALLEAQRRFPAYSEETSPLAYYSHMIEDIITRNVVYPGEASQAEQEGIVRIDLLLLSNGDLKEARIRESSGFSALDDAALAAVQAQAPYPSFPSQITQKELRLVVPVVFKSYLKNE